VRHESLNTQIKRYKTHPFTQPHTHVLTKLLCVKLVSLLKRVVRLDMMIHVSEKMSGDQKHFMPVRARNVQSTVTEVDRASAANIATDLDSPSVIHPVLETRKSGGVNELPLIGYLE
jgi:hypothetical protein